MLSRPYTSRRSRDLLVLANNHTGRADLKTGLPATVSRTLEMNRAYHVHYYPKSFRYLNSWHGGEGRRQKDPTLMVTTGMSTAMNRALRYR